MTLLTPSSTAATPGDAVGKPAIPVAEIAVSRAEAARGPLRRLPVPERVHTCYSTRFVGAALEADRAAFHLSAGEHVAPQVGDVVVARVTRIRSHKQIETAVSRKATLFEDSLVLLAYGHRYAADFFLAHVPDSLDHCHLVAAGGVAGVVTEVHGAVDSPTEIEPLGLLATTDGVVNVRNYGAYRNPLDATPRAERPRVIAVLGTSMNAGKSTVLACLVNGLSRGGQRVGAGKITGTGAGNDGMHYRDAGAHAVLDFTDFGYATTFRTPFEEIRALTLNMISELSDTGVDTIIVEIADGIYQRETAQLLRDPVFRESVDAVVFAASDALGARAGVSELLDAGLPVAAASGIMTRSPLATAEARAVLGQFGVPVVGSYELTDPRRAGAVALAH
ncbi:DUF1611 domain-containing protein [Corynebacterium nasicanis]|uniref:DUF1611 domain-containing protein n=1 Tax=Corynebacterium nasicanis TaxID=1448267 RepID=A0ABW1QE11_9CORY